MYVSIRKMSDYAGSLLKNAWEKTKASVCLGTVHSVYRKTINLSVNGRLLALQADGTPLSPLSLITELPSDIMNTLPIEKGELVRISGESIEICSSPQPFLFTYSEAVHYDLKLPSVFAPLSDGDASRQKARLARNIEDALFHGDTGGFSSIFNCSSEKELSLMLLAAKRRIEDSARLYHNKEFEKSGSTLSSLLGLGIGLTPSGDDFLCGALAGLCLLGKENGPFEKKIKSEIASHLSDTIDISAAFLICALEEQFSLAVNGLAAIPEAEQIKNAFSEIGHSSGMDTLCGVLFVLKLVK